MCFYLYAKRHKKVSIQLQDLFECSFPNFFQLLTLQTNPECQSYEIQTPNNQIPEELFSKLNSLDKHGDWRTCSMVSIYIGWVFTNDDGGLGCRVHTHLSSITASGIFWWPKCNNTEILFKLQTSTITCLNNCVYDPSTARALGLNQN